MSSGNIFSINLRYTKNFQSTSEEISLLKCKEHFKHKGGVSVLHWESIENNAILFSGGVDATIKIWNLDVNVKYNDNYVKTLLGHTGTIISISFCRSRNILLTSSADGSLKVWRIDDNFDKIINPLYHCINTFKVIFYFRNLAIIL